MTLLHNAQLYHAAGLSVLPARRLEKRPAIPSWKEFQKQLPSANHVAAWFANEHDALCVICGQVSGNLEVLDFDHQGELFDAWLAAIPQDICDRLVVEETPSGGYHVAYRCPEGISGNLKLAVGLRDGKRMTLIETRGEGGLVLCAPTEGYELLQGDYACLGALSGNERITLLDAAWRLNELVEENKAEKQANEDTRFTTRPGDDYNACGDFPALLQAHEWVYLRTMPDGNQHWRRPGKEGDHTSATLKDGSFYVFSSNAAPFEPGRGYSAFGACALLEHGGDHAKAAAELAKQGYGTAAEEHPDVDLSGLLGPSGKPVVHLADPAMAKPKGNLGGIIIPDEPEIILPWRTVTNDDVRTAISGTLLEELCNQFAMVTNPPLPLEAVLPKALVLCGAALSQQMPVGAMKPTDGNMAGCVGHGPKLAKLKINTGGGQVCNFFSILAAPSSSGKDIGSFLELMAMRNNWFIGTSGSGEGLAEAFTTCPNGLLCISELQPWLDAKNWQHRATEFLTFSFNKGFFKQNFSSRGGKGSIRSADYCYPNIIAYVQPGVFEKVVATIDLENGFLGRFLFTKMPEFFCEANVFDPDKPLDIMANCLDVFKRKQGVVNVPLGYSRGFRDIFQKHAAPELGTCWKRLAAEYYPRLAVVLSVRHSVKTQGEMVTLTDDCFERAAVLVNWFFAHAEKLILSVNDADPRVKERENIIRKVFLKIRKLDRGDGVTIRDVSISGIRNSTSKERREALLELIDRGHVVNNSGRYSIISTPPEWDD